MQVKFTTKEKRRTSTGWPQSLIRGGGLKQAANTEFYKRKIETGCLIVRAVTYRFDCEERNKTSNRLGCFNAGSIERFCSIRFFLVKAAHKT